MEKNLFKGKLMLVEGLDRSGKTSASKQAAAELGLVYFKGLGRDSGIGWLAKKYSSTFLFMLESWYVSSFILKKMLRRGESVLVDRYFFSAAAYLPDCEYWYNRFWIKFFQAYLIKPDVAFCFKVSPTERLRRLKNGSFNKFHQELINDPDLMKRREAKLEAILKGNQFNVHYIDTTMRSIDQSKECLKHLIRPYLKKRRNQNGKEI